MSGLLFLSNDKNALLKEKEVQVALANNKSLGTAEPPVPACFMSLVPIWHKLYHL